MNLPAIEYAPTPKARAVLTLEDESIRILLLQIAKSLVPEDNAVTVNISTEGELGSPHQTSKIVRLGFWSVGKIVQYRASLARSPDTLRIARPNKFFETSFQRS